VTVESQVYETPQRQRPQEEKESPVSKLSPISQPNEDLRNRVIVTTTTPPPSPHNDDDHNHRPPSPSNQSIISSLSLDVTLSLPQSPKQSHYPSNLNLVSRPPPVPQLIDTDIVDGGRMDFIGSYFVQIMDFLELCSSNQNRSYEGIGRTAGLLG